MQKHFQELVRALAEKANTTIKVGDDGKIFCDCGEFPLLVEYLEGPEQVFMTASVGTVPRRGVNFFTRSCCRGNTCSIRPAGLPWRWMLNLHSLHYR